MKIHKNLLYLSILLSIGSCNDIENDQVSENEQSFGRQEILNEIKRLKKEKEELSLINPDDSSLSDRMLTRRIEDLDKKISFKECLSEIERLKKEKEELSLINTDGNSLSGQMITRQIENLNKKILLKEHLLEFIENKSEIIKLLRKKYPSDLLSDECLCNYVCDLIECVLKDIEFVNNGYRLKQIPYDRYVIPNPGMSCALVSNLNSHWRNETYINEFNEAFLKRSERANDDIRSKKIDLSIFENFECLHAMRILTEWNNEVVDTADKDLTYGDRCKIMEKYVHVEMDNKGDKRPCEDEFYSKYGKKKEFDDREIMSLPFFDFINRDYSELCIPDDSADAGCLLFSLLKATQGESKICIGCFYDCNSYNSDREEMNKKYSSFLGKDMVYDVRISSCKPWEQVKIIKEMAQRGFSLKTVQVFLCETGFLGHCYCYVYDKNKNKIRCYSECIENTYYDCLCEPMSYPKQFCFVKIKDRDKDSTEKWLHLFDIWGNRIRKLFEYSFTDDEDFHDVLLNFALFYRYTSETSKLEDFLKFYQGTTEEKQMYLDKQLFQYCFKDFESIAGKFKTLKLQEVIREYFNENHLKNNYIRRLRYTSYLQYLDEYLSIKDKWIQIDRLPDGPWGVKDEDSTKIIPTTTYFIVKNRMLKYNPSGVWEGKMPFDLYDYDNLNWSYLTGICPVECLKINNRIVHSRLAFGRTKCKFPEGQYIMVSYKNGIDRYITSFDKEKSLFLGNLTLKENFYSLCKPQSRDNLFSNEKFDLFFKLSGINRTSKTKIREDKEDMKKSEVLWEMLNKKWITDSSDCSGSAICALSGKMKVKLLDSEENASSEINGIYVNTKGTVNGSRTINENGFIGTLNVDNNDVTIIYPDEYDNNWSVKPEFDDQQRVKSEKYQLNGNDAGSVQITYEEPPYMFLHNYYDEYDKNKNCCHWEDIFYIKDGSASFGRYLSDKLVEYYNIDIPNISLTNDSLIPTRRGILAKLYEALPTNQK